MDGILVPISLFVLIGVVAVAIEYFKYRRRQDQQITVRTAIEKGEGLSPDVLESIANRRYHPDRTCGAASCSSHWASELAHSVSFWARRTPSGR